MDYDLRTWDQHSILIFEDNTFTILEAKDEIPMIDDSRGIKQGKFKNAAFMDKELIKWGL